MTQGPEIHKRPGDAPPSDLPEKPLAYPGKPLTHKFSPVEQVRHVEEATTQEAPNLANNVPFTPIASITYPDKNIHLGPVRNTHTRSVQPVALSGKLFLPKGGAGIFEVAPDLRTPLEARVGRFLANKPEPVSQPSTNTAAAQGVETSPPQEASNVGQIHTELEKVKELARAELAKRGGGLIQPITEAPIVPQATVEPTPAEEKIETAAPSTTTVPKAETPPEDETAQILLDAEKLEKELAALSNAISAPKERGVDPLTQREEPGPVSGLQEPVDEHKQQLSQLLADKNELLAKINDLTASYNQTRAEKTAHEERLKKATEDFERKLAQSSIDRTNLVAKIKSLEETVGEVTTKQAGLEKEQEKAQELKNKLVATERQRDEERLRAQKLQSLLEEVSGAAQKRQVPEVSREVVTPVPIKEPEEEQTAPRVVKAQAAAGKMAPSLTSAPNVINGVVKDSQGRLLYNVIIVVKDEAGQPVRALKSNKIGQFAISTPLPNGVYTMELEAPDKSFDIIEVDLGGKVLPPIEIRARN